MAERPVVNASPLILLPRGGWLHLLQLAGEEIVVPLGVADEIQRRGPADPTAQALSRTPWLAMVTTPPIPALIHAWDLGPGESSVLAWAYTYSGTEAIVDDLPARRCAAALGIPVRGTLGLVLTASSGGFCLPHDRLWSSYVELVCISRMTLCDKPWRWWESETVALGYAVMHVLSMACVHPVHHYRLPVGLLHPGDPVEVLRIVACNLLIGIFWKRFRTPTQEAQSGTAHALLTADQAWQERG